ncbi:MAG: C-terminal helicase domain-containing protein, partial [Vulcanisaeta sp.]
ITIYDRLLMSGLRGEDVAIITTYRAQATLIMKAMDKLGIREKPPTAHLVSEYRDANDEGYIDEDSIESLMDLRASSTVDSYQGREKRVIIYSMVADRYHRALWNYARFNVAVSRAKEKLIILSSMRDEDLKRLPWIYSLTRWGSVRRNSISTEKTCDEKVRSAVNNALKELRKVSA